MRLIDADAYEFPGDLVNEPTIDAVPVRHGEWKYNPNGMDWGLGAWECSLCHAQNNNLGMGNNINPYMFVGSNWCPQCGAKMDGKGEK